MKAILKKFPHFINFLWVRRTASTENAAPCGDRACRGNKNAGESAICPVRAQPSAEIVRVQCAKCRRECDLSPVRATLCEDRACRVRGMQARVRFLSPVRATLCGDRACPVREMQARVRFVPCARNPLRRLCVSSARNAGESAIGPVCAQPSAEIVRVECAKRRRECDLSRVRATLCGDRARRVREMQTRVRFVPCARNPLWRSRCLAHYISSEDLHHFPLPAADIDTHTDRDSYTHITHRDSDSYIDTHTHRDPHSASTHST